MMWAIGLYAALGWLHKYYEDNRQQMVFAPKFWMFLLDDLILKFRLPSRLFPLFALVLLLLWILGYTDYYFQLSGCVWVLLFVALFFVVPFGWLGASSGLFPKIQIERERMRLATLLEKERDLVEERIRGKLEGYQWFGTAVMKDLATVWGVGTDYFDTAFAAYAVKHPEETVFGRVYLRENKELVTISRVLISLKNLDSTKYFYIEG